MEDITTPREKILKRVRAALLNKFAAQFPDVEMESDIFSYSDPDKAVAFGKEFTASGGSFIYCHNEFDFHENLLIWLDKRGIKHLFVSDPELKKEMENLGLSQGGSPYETDSVPLLQAEAVIARNGSVVFSSSGTQRDALNMPVIAVKARLSKLCDDMRQALVILRNRYGEKLPSMMSILNGSIPIGEGGKKDREIVLFLINDRL